VSGNIGLSLFQEIKNLIVKQRRFMKYFEPVITNTQRTRNRNIFEAVVVYLSVLGIAYWLLPGLPGPRLWDSVDTTFKFGPFFMSLYALLHITLAFPLYLYGAYLFKVETDIRKPGRPPVKPENRGLDGQVRHPLIGYLMVSSLALGFATDSLYGLGFGLFCLMVFSLYGWFRERSRIAPLFGETYRAFSYRVRTRYFNRLTGLYVLTLLFLGVAGLAL
jgi:protein-S-isoprenylcysteine O-methyltransferase Ste14